MGFRLLLKSTAGLGAGVRRPTARLWHGAPGCKRSAFGRRDAGRRQIFSGGPRAPGELAGVPVAR